MELFDALMNCLRVIQSDKKSINQFLTNIEESTFDGDEVKVSKKILNSIEILSKHDDHRSKIEIIHVLGVILIEKISEDADNLNNSGGRPDFEGLMVVSQVTHKLFTFFEIKNITEEHEDWLLH